MYNTIEAYLTLTFHLILNFNGLLFVFKGLIVLIKIKMN